MSAHGKSSHVNQFSMWPRYIQKPTTFLWNGETEVVAKGKSWARVTMCTYFTVGHMQSALQLFRHALHCCFYQKVCDVAGFQEVTTDASSFGLYAQFDGCQVFGSRMGAREAWLISHLQLFTVCLPLEVFEKLLCCHSVRQDGVSWVRKSSRGSDHGWWWLQHGASSFETINITHEQCMCLAIWIVCLHRGMKTFFWAKELVRTDHCNLILPTSDANCLYSLPGSCCRILP